MAPTPRGRASKQVLEDRDRARVMQGGGLIGLVLLGAALLFRPALRHASPWPEQGAPSAKVDAPAGVLDAAEAAAEAAAKSRAEAKTADLVAETEKAARTIAEDGAAAAACEDKDTTCRHWAQKNECLTNKEFMDKTCCHSCREHAVSQAAVAAEHAAERAAGVAETEAVAAVNAAATAARCADSEEKCTEWARSGECERNAEWMTKSCCHRCARLSSPARTIYVGRDADCVRGVCAAASSSPRPRRRRRPISPQPRRQSPPRRQPPRVSAATSTPSAESGRVAVSASGTARSCSSRAATGVVTHSATVVSPCKPASVVATMWARAAR